MCSLKHTHITHNHFYVLKAQKIYYELYYINQTTEIRHSPAPRNSPSDGNQKDVQCCHIAKKSRRGKIYKNKIFLSYKQFFLLIIIYLLLTEFLFVVIHRHTHNKNLLGKLIDCLYLFIL